MTTAAVRPTHPRGAVTELIAVLLMTVGSVLVPVIGWLVGVVLLWFSPLLRWREKLLATLVVPGGVGTLLIVGVTAAGATTHVSQVCHSQPQIAVRGGANPHGPMTCTSYGPSGFVTGLFVVGAVLLFVAPIVLGRVSQRGRV